MIPYLLDINVLIALAWPSHVHHRATQKWFAGKRAAGFRTCPITQTGFVRISSNPKLTPDSTSPGEALALLQRVTALPQHQFWPDHLTLLDAIGNKTLLVGHQQVTDAYLLALARFHAGALATLDRGVLSLAGANPETVELIDNI